jgi:hypothetical protein
MDLIGLLLILLIVGVVLAFFPIDGTIKNVILCIVVIAVILTLFHAFGGSSPHWHL